MEFDQLEEKRTEKFFKEQGLIEYRARDLHIQTEVRVNFRKCIISTVALGINHSWRSEKGLWYETMIFKSWAGRIIHVGGELYCNRYETRQEALEAHERLVRGFNNGYLTVKNYELVLVRVLPRFVRIKDFLLYIKGAMEEFNYNCYGNLYSMGGIREWSQ